MLGKLLGQKQEKYFLELSEEELSQTAPAVEAAPAPVVENPPGETTETPAAVAPVVEKAPVSGTPAPVVPSAPAPEVASVNFATDYLLTVTGGRRRPGKNMESFLNLARQMRES